MDLLDRYRYYLRIDKNLSNNTIDSYTRDINNFLSFLKTSGEDTTTAKRKNIQDFIVLLLDTGVHHRSIARLISSLKNFYLYLLKEKIVNKNPTANIKTPKFTQKLPEVLSKEEINNIVKNIGTKTWLALRDRAIFELMYSSGLRVSEVINLEHNHINAEENLLSVKQGKGSKDRITIISDESLRAIAKYLDVLQKHKPNYNGQYLFIGKNMTPITRQAVWQNLKKYALKAGLDKNMYPHILRHSFATHLLEGGANIRVIQTLLGHTNIVTTEIYTQIKNEYLEQEYNKYHPRNKNIVK